MTGDPSKSIENRQESGGKPLKLSKIGFGYFAWKVGRKKHLRKTRKKNKISRPYLKKSAATALPNNDYDLKASQEFAEQVGPSIGRHLVGVWIGGAWNGHFPESETYFSEAKISSKILEFPQKERFSPKSQAPKFENSEPEKMQFHTSSHSIPPLDSLLFYSHNEGSHQKFTRTPAWEDKFLEISFSQCRKRG